MLERLTDRIFYYPHQIEYDRPLLAYVQGSKYTLAIDAGYSANHVHDFYAALAKEGKRKPDLTVITHWHYDHTFGMSDINGISIAHYKTNEFLKVQQIKALDTSYQEMLMREDAFFC